jgi:hypothetical protein
MDGKPADKFFSTIEQLWFAYIMKTRLGKKWIQECWIAAPL